LRTVLQTAGLGLTPDELYTEFKAGGYLAFSRRALRHRQPAVLGLPVVKRCLLEKRLISLIMGDQRPHGAGVLVY
jgi:hypothetical protein